MSQSVCSFGWQFISWDLTIDVWLCKQPEGCDDDDNDDDEVLIARLPAGIIDKPKSTQEKNPDKEHKKKRDLCCKRAKVCTITRQHGAKFKTPVILVRIKCKSRVLKYAWLKGFELIKRFTLKCNKNFFSPPMCFKALALKKRKEKSEYHSKRVIELQDVRVSMCVRGREGGFMYIALLFDRLCGWAPSSVAFLLICRHFFLFLAAAFH